MPLRRDDALLAGVLGCLIVLAYVPALGAGFYSDDFQWLGRMAPTLENPLYIFSIFYRDFNPVLHLSFLLDYLAGGGAAAFFHATSLLVHAVCTVLLYALCRRHCSHRWVAAAAALTWGLNGRLSEAVIWPAARGHSLAALFVLAALLCLGSESGRRRWLAPPLFLLALLSKEVALFPMLLAPLFTPEPRRCKRVLGALYLVGAGFMAFNMVSKPDFHLAQDGPGIMALKVPFILLRPLGLGDLYDFSFLMLAFVLATFMALIVLLRGTAGLAGLLWVLACLIPVAPLAQMSSRYLYLLSIGYALALCGAWDAVSSRLPTVSVRRVAGGMAIGMMAIVVTADVLSIGREIEDYDLLSRPYEACVEALREEVRGAPAGATLIVIDTSDRQAVPELNRLIAERGGMMKLIPYRPQGVGGLVELPDILNIVGGGEGMLASAADPGPSRNPLVLVYDGRRAWRARELPPQPLPADRVLAARLSLAAR